MLDPKRLLAATDLSAPARRAAERAALLAKDTGASLDLVYVANLEPLDELRRLVVDAPADLEQCVIDSARKEVNELAAALQRSQGISAGVHIGSGRAPAELSIQADRIGADLIILGARGTSFLRHLLLGSTAERMVSTTTRPLLVVKQPAHECYRKVLVPVDFSPASLSSLQNAHVIAPHAGIVLSHTYDVPFEGALRLASVDEKTIERYRAAARREALQKLQALSREAGLPPHAVRLVAVHGDPVLNILEQEQNHDCDLIVMGKHGRNTFKELLLGSATRQVLARSQADVLVSV